LRHHRQPLLERIVLGLEVVDGVEPVLVLLGAVEGDVRIAGDVRADADERAFVILGRGFGGAGGGGTAAAGALVVSARAPRASSPGQRFSIQSSTGAAI
jgi:hypothetical protein